MKITELTRLQIIVALQKPPIKSVKGRNHSRVLLDGRIEKWIYEVAPEAHRAIVSIYRGKGYGGPRYAVSPEAYQVVKSIAIVPESKFEI